MNDDHHCFRSLSILMMNDVDATKIRVIEIESDDDDRDRDHDGNRIWNDQDQYLPTVHQRTELSYRERERLPCFRLGDRDRDDR